MIYDFQAASTGFGKKFSGPGPQASQAFFMFKRVISTFSLLVAAARVVTAAAAPVADKPVLPPDLFYEFKAVPAAENAILDWRRAAAAEVPLNDHQKQVMAFCWTPAAREPGPDELDSLQAWLKRNHEALALFAASLAKRQAQWPERNPQNAQPELIALSLMIHARLFAADQMAEHNQFAAAAGSLEESLKLAQTGVEGDPAVVNYLVACRARTLTQDAILRLASRQSVPVSLLEGLLNQLPGLAAETNMYDHVLRMEFTRDYYESLDLKQLAERWERITGTNATILSYYYPEDLQRAFRVLMDPSLVALHPKPFDASAEIELDIRRFRIYRTNSLNPWTGRNNEVELEREESRTNLAQAIAPLMELVKDDPLPLNRPAVQKARAAYLAIENPVGRILDTSILGFVASDLKVCQVRTEREATRAVLALLIFEKRKGHLPAALSDLVREKILDAVPGDPFRGEPLHYSREKRKLWSVSDNGEDDHGESGQSRWFEKDAVWPIPEIK